MLSSFVYSKFRAGIESRAYRFGVRVYQVNPAGTKVIGRVKFASRYGLTVHHSAALVIARRICRFSERAPPGCQDEVIIPNNKGDHVTFSLPARNRGKHVWSFWLCLVQEIEKSGACSTGSGDWVNSSIQPNAGAFGWDWGATFSRILIGEIPSHESFGNSARPTWLISMTYLYSG